MALITLGANSGKGKVLQVSNLTTVTVQQTVTTATFTDLTNATVTITPNSTSNKILLIAHIGAKNQVGSTGYGMKFFRDSTEVYGTSNNIAVYHIDALERSIGTFVYIDTPSTTSQITYKIQVSTYLGNEVRFQNSADTNFYAMEIEG